MKNEKTFFLASFPAKNLDWISVFIVENSHIKYANKFLRDPVIIFSFV